MSRQAAAEHTMTVAHPSLCAGRRRAAIRFMQLDLKENNQNAIPTARSMCPLAPGGQLVRRPSWSAACKMAPFSARSIRLRIFAPYPSPLLRTLSTCPTLQGYETTVCEPVISNRKHVSEPLVHTPKGSENRSRGSSLCSNIDLRDPRA